MDVAIVDYGAGNVFSVATALERLGARVTVTADEKKIRDASRVVFPGVGQASAAMEHLKNTGLDALIPRLTQPVLGICLGMQLMCRRTEEGDTAGLGIFPLAVERFPEGPVKLKVPHMGWNTVEGLRTGLFEGVAAGNRMYFVHSYFVPGRYTAGRSPRQWRGTIFSGASSIRKNLRRPGGVCWRIFWQKTLKNG